MVDSDYVFMQEKLITFLLYIKKLNDTNSLQPSGCNGLIASQNQLDLTDNSVITH